MDKIPFDQIGLIEESNYKINQLLKTTGGIGLENFIFKFIELILQFILAAA